MVVAELSILAGVNDLLPNTRFSLQGLPETLPPPTSSHLCGSLGQVTGSTKLKGLSEGSPLEEYTEDGSHLWSYHHHPRLRQWMSGFCNDNIIVCKHVLEHSERHQKILHSTMHTTFLHLLEFWVPGRQRRHESCLHLGGCHPHLTRKWGHWSLIPIQTGVKGLPPVKFPNWFLLTHWKKTVRGYYFAMGCYTILLLYF